MAASLSSSVTGSLAYNHTTTHTTTHGTEWKKEGFCLTTVANTCQIQQTNVCMQYNPLHNSRQSKNTIIEEFD